MAVRFATGVQYVGDRSDGATFRLVHVPDPGASRAPEVVRVDTVDGAGTAIPNVDYTPLHQTLTFNPGESSRTIKVPIARVERDRSIVLSLDRAPYPGGMPDPVTTPDTSEGGWFFSGGKIPSGLRTNRPADDRGLPNPSRTPGAVAFVVHEPDQTPPTIRESHLIFGGGQVSGFVVTFSQPMAPGPSSDPGNYRIVRQGRAGADEPVPLASATYDPDRHAVTLVPSAPVRVGSFVLRSPTPSSRSPIVSESGTPLDGNSDGLPDGLLYANFATLGPIAGFSLARQVRQNTLALSNQQRHGLFHKVFEPIGRVLDPLGLVKGVAGATAPRAVDRLKKQ